MRCLTSPLDETVVRGISNRIARAAKYALDEHCGIGRRVGEVMTEGTRWLIGTAIAAVGLVIATLAWVYPKAPASPRPVSAASSANPAITARPIPTIGEIRYTQLQVGDCLTGSNLHLNTSGALPVLIHVVSCGQAHIAEVFFASQTYWNKS